MKLDNIIRAFVLVSIINVFITFDIHNYFALPLVYLAMVCCTIEIIIILVYVKIMFTISTLKPSVISGNKIFMFLTLSYHALFTYIILLYIISSVFRTIEKILSEYSY